MSEDGYTTDIVYPSAFGAFQSPVHLVHAAWLGGRAGPDVDAPFTYVDLGCGAGLTVCVLADCYPHAQFHGVDLNEEHVRRGRALALRAGLRNVQFHCMDFASLPRLAIDSADFIGLSGVYSWLTPNRKAACMDFVGARLAPSGILFLHYAALPGNAQVDALYTLIREAAQGVEGDSLTRFRVACQAVERLRKAQARFFRINPQADAWMARLPEEEPRAMAHEVLNAQRSSLSVRDAATDAAKVGLAYVANAQIELNHLELSAPNELRADLQRRDPVAREMMMDAVRNTHSRMDVMMRGGPAETAMPQLWVDRLNTGPAIRQREDLKAKTGVDLMAPVYSQLLHRIEYAPARIGDLLAEPLLAPFVDRETALQHLAALKLVHFLRRPYAKPSSSGRPAMASRLNQLVLEDEIEAAGAIPFASPAAGTQVLLGLPDRLALLALTGGDVEAAWRKMNAGGRRVTVAGQAVDSAAGLRDAASARASAMGARIVANLARLGVVDLR